MSYVGLQIPVFWNPRNFQLRACEISESSSIFFIEFVMFLLNIYEINKKQLNY